MKVVLQTQHFMMVLYIKHSSLGSVIQIFFFFSLLNTLIEKGFEYTDWVKSLYLGTLSLFYL